MAIWEPCNYVSNLAYDRLVVELCTQADWVMDLDTLNDIRSSVLTSHWSRSGQILSSDWFSHTYDCVFMCVNGNQ